MIAKIRFNLEKRVFSGWVRIVLIRSAVLFSFYLLAFSVVSANSGGVDFAGQRADSFEKKKLDRKVWTHRERSLFKNKTFPITDWDKHYSALGSKRAPIAVDEKKEKERFEARIIEREVKSIKMSRWNERLVELHKRAEVSLDDEAQIAADQQLYQMALEDREQFAELAESLSLRDINRFHYRRNRSDESVPTKRAGEGE